MYFQLPLEADLVYAIWWTEENKHRLTIYSFQKEIIP